MLFAHVNAHKGMMLVSKAARNPQRQQIPMPDPPFSHASGNIVCDGNIGTFQNNQHDSTPSLHNANKTNGTHTTLRAKR